MMSINSDDRKENLSIRMGNYYSSNFSYHLDVADISGERPSDEEKTLFQIIQHNYSPQNSSSKILEIGCGECDSAKVLISMLNAEEYYGIDASPTAIESAHRKYPEYNLSVGDTSRLAFNDNSFDIVVFNYVLEHMVYPDKVMSEAIRVTRPGGIVAMIVPVCDLPWLIPNSLRYQRQNINFLIPYTISRWIEFLRIRYLANYYSFRPVYEPIVLLEQNENEYTFQPDDDLVYIASSFEITKYLIKSKCDVLFKGGRDIMPCIANGKRPIIDWLRLIIFTLLRLSLNETRIENYTTTTSIIARQCS